MQTPDTGDSDAPTPDGQSPVAPVPRSTRGRTGRGPRPHGLGVGNIVGTGFSVWLSNIVPFTLLALIIFSPLTIYHILQHLGVIGGRIDYTDEGAIVYSTMPAIIEGLISFGLQQLLAATLIFGVFQKLRRRKTSIGESLSRGLEQLIPVTLVTIVFTLAILLAAAPGLALVALQSPALMLVGSILMLIGFAYVGCALSCAAPATVVERLSVGQALSRSWNLTKGRRSTVFLTILTFYLMVLLISIPLGLIIGILTFAIDNDSVLAIMQELLMVPFYALQSVVIAVMYHDLRVFKEGIDTEQLAQIFD